MLSKIVLVLVVAAVGSSIAADPPCTLNGTWDSSCVSPQMVIMDGPMQMALVNMHNKYRNLVASGSYSPNYTQAANMRNMSWDAGLANTSTWNVKQCRMNHDNCRNTPEFTPAGQNLASFMTTGPLNTTPPSIAALAETWYTGEQGNGKDYGWMNLINNFNTSTNTTGRVVGHMTQFVWAETRKVGCSAATYIYTTSDNRKFNSLLLACNYGPAGNYVGKPVYLTGTPASKCPAGTSSKSPNTALCS